MLCENFIFDKKHSSTSRLFTSVPQNCRSKSVRKFPGKVSMIVFFNAQHTLF